MREEKTIRVARFDERVCTYWLLSGVITMTFTVVLIPLIPIWFFLGSILTRRYLESMECVLTSRALKFKKGVFVRIEKTIPLEKITDMGMVQGPIMRQFGLSTLTIETAGQSGAGALLSMTGVIDAPGFRELVLEQRDRQAPDAPTDSTPTATTQDAPVLEEIRDSLLRIEKLLTQSSPETR